MIVGVGVDLCEIARIEKIISKNEEAFKARLLAEGETCKSSAASYAKRFAAKEAVSKALGCGIGEKLSFQDMTVANHQSGQPYVVLSEKVQQHFGALKLHVSISDEAGLAIAYVIAEKA